MTNVCKKILTFFAATMLLMAGVFSCCAEESDADAGFSDIAVVKLVSGIRAELPQEYKSLLTSDSEVDACIDQLYEQGAYFEQKVRDIAASARDEYLSYPAEERDSSLKSKIVSSKMGTVSALEKECDQKVNGILRRMEKLLREKDMGISLVSKVRGIYENKKAGLKNSLSKQMG